MKITFNIEYRTNWGYSVFIVGNVKELGLGNVDDAVRMQYTSNDLWTFSLELKTDIRNLEYYYVVMSEDGNVFDLEWGDPHRLLPCRDNVTHVNIFDSWKPIPSNKPFYSSAFTQGVFARTCKPSFTEAVGNDVVMKIMAPMVTPEQVLAISGEIPSLGEWNVNKALIMDSTNFPEWVVAFSTAGVSKPFEYKFLLLDRHTHEVIAWENCNNRNYGILSGSNEVVELSGLQFNNPLPLWKGAGTAIPVFSLRSEEDMGVGDFYDLMKMVDWAEQSGQRIIQLLPINDTTMTHTWMDSYPYNANSTFALHPMYIRPSAVGELSNVSKINDFNARAKQLNELPQVDYEQVNALKTEYMRCLYDEIGEKQKKFVPFRSFVKNNLYWLKPYAAFCVLRDKFNTPDFTKWSEFSVYNEAAVDIFAAEHANEIEFVYFVQFHLDKQLREVRNYAHKHGVVLKGDIPIGISRTSVDAWTSPQLFNMNSQAGAPPDDFSVLGQNWGFPTYNWEEMEKDGFTWWKNRFRKMAEYFDAYRIDHILGFFRIWQIPIRTRLSITKARRLGA